MKIAIVLVIIALILWAPVGAQALVAGANGVPQAPGMPSSGYGLGCPGCPGCPDSPNTPAPNEPVCY